MDTKQIKRHRRSIDIPGHPRYGEYKYVFSESDLFDILKHVAEDGWLEGHYHFGDPNNKDFEDYWTEIENELNN